MFVVDVVCWGWLVDYEFCVECIVYDCVVVGFCELVVV